MWHVVIIEGESGYLTMALNKLESQGWQVRHVLPNGKDRWTVCAFNASVPAPPRLGVD